MYLEPKTITDKQTNTYQQHNWIQLAEFDVRLIQNEV